MKHLFLGSFTTGPPVVNEDDERHESAAHHSCDQYNGCPVQAVRDGVEGSLRQIAKKWSEWPKAEKKSLAIYLACCNCCNAACVLGLTGMSEDAMAFTLTGMGSREAILKTGQTVLSRRRG